MLHTRSWGSVAVTSVDRRALLDRLAALARELRARCPEVEEVLLFGSYARGDHLPESDVDLLLVVSEARRPSLLRADPYRDHFAALPMDVNLLVATHEERQRAAEGRDVGVLGSALTEGIRLDESGEPENGKLLERLDRASSEPPTAEEAELRRQHRRRHRRSVEDSW